MDAPHEQHDAAQPSQGGGDVAQPAPPTSDDALLAIRAELDEVEQLPIGERAEVFERTHRIVVDELRALELG